MKAALGDLAALADRIEARTAALAERSTEVMYRNPFWDARFGERGRRFALEDARHHVAYLVEALRAGTADGLVAYARWLQTVLTTRGMCSRHLDESFARLGEALAAERLDDVAPAAAFLDDARSALVYAAGPAAAVVREIPALAAATAAELHRRHPDWKNPARCEDDIVYHLSYLADALALGRPALFAEHVRWMRGFLARYEVAGQLDETFDVLHERLAALDAATAESARAVLAGART